MDEVRYATRKCKPMPRSYTCENQVRNSYQRENEIALGRQLDIPLQLMRPRMVLHRELRSEGADCAN